jgi:hypothetical protein
VFFKAYSYSAHLLRRSLSARPVVSVSSRSVRPHPSPSGAVSFPSDSSGRHCRGRRASQQTTVPTRYPACPRRQRSDDHHRSRPSSASSRAACGLTLPVSSPLLRRRQRGGRDAVPGGRAGRAAHLLRDVGRAAAARQPPRRAHLLARGKPPPSSLLPTPRLACSLALSDWIEPERLRARSRGVLWRRAGAVV